MYRWHVMDPIRFESDLRVTIQALGWRTHKDRQYLPLQDDIASVAYWYQTLPSRAVPGAARPRLSRSDLMDVGGTSRKGMSPSAMPSRRRRLKIAAAPSFASIARAKSWSTFGRGATWSTIVRTRRTPSPS